MNDFARFLNAFDGIEPYSGTPPKGFLVDWLGALTDGNFRTIFGINPSAIGGHQITTRLPTVSDGEGWFEAVNQVEAAKAARDRFVMVTLGACYGSQAVGSFLALQKLNPMPSKLVAVEPEPENLKWVAKHFRDNGIDPDQHWLVGSAISDSNRPIFFPVGSPGSGAQNSFSTNDIGARRYYAKTLIEGGHAEDALRSLLIENTTGLKKQLVPGSDAFEAEIKLMSAITLNDVLSPFDFVDYVEVDIQQSEIIVFPPFMDLVKRKVRRVHIGTHGTEVHAELSGLFKKDGWEMVFDLPPNSEHQTPYGNFSLNDGVLSVVNPAL